MALHVPQCESAEWAIDASGYFMCAAGSTTFSIVELTVSNVDPSLSTSDYYEILGLRILVMTVAYGFRQISNLILNRT